MPPATFKLGPLEVPLPGKWAGAFAFLAFVGLLGWGGLTAYDHLDSDSKRIAPADLIQLEHAQRHLIETPESTMTAFSDVRGSMLLRLYSSDNCLLYERRANGFPASTRFVPDVSRTIQAKRPDRPVYVGSSPAWAQGRCLTLAEHGEPTKTWNEPIDSCRVRAVRLYSDGCRASAIWDACTSTWGAWSFDVCRH